MLEIKFNALYQDQRLKSFFFVNLRINLMGQIPLKPVDFTEYASAQAR